MLSDEELLSIQSLDDLRIEIQETEGLLGDELASGRDPEKISQLEAELNELRATEGRCRAVYQKFITGLLDVGAFPSREIAATEIPFGFDDWHHLTGRDGIPAFDGNFEDDDEYLDGMRSLLNLHDYTFQCPVARNPHAIQVEEAFEGEDFRFRITSNCGNLIVFDDVGIVDLGYGEPFGSGLDGWVWLEGTIKGSNFWRLARRVEQLRRELHGALIVLDLVSYFEWVKFPSPPLTLGRNKTYRRTGLQDASSRLCSAFTLAPKLSVGEKVDPLRGFEGTVSRRWRSIRRLFAAKDEHGRRVRQAMQMVLRSFDGWSNGEKALFIATALEGLLLDSRQREDLSLRLQDSVAFLVGLGFSDRKKLRADVGGLYKARSEFVHTGEADPKNFDPVMALGIAKRVLIREMDAIM